MLNLLYLLLLTLAAVLLAASMQGVCHLLHRLWARDRHQRPNHSRNR